MNAEELKAQAEEANWRMAHEWYAGLALTLSGVNLAETITYDVLRIGGGIWKKYMDEQAVKDGAPTISA